MLPWNGSGAARVKADDGAGSLLSHGATKYPSMELQAAPASKLRRAIFHVASSRRAAKVTLPSVPPLSPAHVKKNYAAKDVGRNRVYECYQ
jgi:hypothetical protein